MDLEMWRIATLLREDSAAMAVYVSDGPPGLLRCYLTGKLNPPAQTAIESFFGRYGARGLAEIDAGRPRWRDEPEHLFETLGAYLETTDPDNSPAGLFRRGAGKASDAVGRIEMAARASASGLRGRARASRVRFAASRAREFLGFREYPKFFAIRMLDIFRQQLKTIGEELAREQELSQADDIFYLTLTEHRNLGKGLLSAASARAMIAERREEYQRELLRRQIPRLIVSDGRTFYEGMSDAAPKTSPRGADAARGLVGSPVSPGIVEGRARVVLDPRQSALKPGEIMVCPGTDPSWTPLFLVASGLVMEVGGMMTHGAVVAREYGLPAVVGVHEATSRITTGMLIRVDGSAGNVEIVDEGGQ
jgi:pyruvate,water dikinase